MRTIYFCILTVFLSSLLLGPVSSEQQVPSRPVVVVDDTTSHQMRMEDEDEATVEESFTLAPSCERILSVLSDQMVMGTSNKDESTTMMLALHHNGNPDPCHVSTFSLERLREAVALFPQPDDLRDCNLSKYQVEAILTVWMQLQIQKANGGSECTREPRPKDKQASSSSVMSFLDYCDPGPDYTVIQHDHDMLVRLPSSNTLPCRFFTREGVRITSLFDVKDLFNQVKGKGSLSQSNEDSSCQQDGETCEQAALHLYAVPAGRVFMFGTSHVGEKFYLEHVKDSVGNSLIIETLSVNPRVFDIHNFFSPKEANALVERALSEKSETHKLHRSTTGTVGKSVINKRTSENAWDTSSPVAQKIKKRCFAALGIDEYQEGMSDGLQILRYNMTTAYNSHMDYFDNPESVPYDYDSSGTGGNRFATILLYFTDLPENGGGETAFTSAPLSPKVDFKQALKDFRATPESKTLSEGSWEEQMTVRCRSNLNVKPRLARAVLFYSQYPDGREDHLSLHGGCPVLNGTKWAANLWVVSVLCCYAVVVLCFLIVGSHIL